MTASAPATGTAEPTTWVGRPVPRLEDPALITGVGNYVADIVARDAGCLHARFVRSTVAAGRLVSVSAPADVMLYTAAELAGIAPIAPYLTRPDYVAADTPILATDVVRFSGEPVAVVLAASEALAEDAAEQVDVEIETFDPILDVTTATAPGARLIHPGPYPGDPNTVIDGRMTTRGFAKAAAAADHQVRIDVSCSRQSAMPLEPRASHAAYDHTTGRVTLHTTTQMPHVVRTGIADCLGIPEDDLRVVAPDVGGGFGAKMSLAREDVVLVHLARKLRRNVAWIETREENFLSAWHSREQEYQIIGSFNSDGTLVALEADLVSDVGAYSCYPVTFGVEPLMAFAELPGPYVFEHYSVRSRGVLSNKCPIAPYRGVSRPVQTLAMEHLMDRAADELGIDRIEIRLTNLVREYPYTSPTGMVLDPSSHIEALRYAREVADLPSFQERQAKALAEGRYLGIGFSCFAERTGYGTPAFAARSMGITVGYEQIHLAMDPSGNVVLRIGTSPHGQGLRTSLAQLVADELGLVPENVRVVHSDTDATPYGWGSFGSRAMVLSGGAALTASRQLHTRLVEIAADMLECSPDDVELADGAAQVRGTGTSLPIREIARLAHHSSHKLPAGHKPGLEEEATYDPGGTFSNAVHVAEVEVEPATGKVRIQRFFVVEDAGVLVNPAIVDGQVHGGVVQGIANALLEELIYDDSGVLTTTSLMDFLPPTIAEVPDIDIHHMSTISDFTLTGAKGVGEGGAIGSPAAIINAINDAISPFEARITHIPATPARVRDVIRTGGRDNTNSGGQQ